MKKLSLSVLLLLMLFLSACGGGNNAADNAANNNEPAQEANSGITVLEDTEIEPEAPASFEASGPATCTAESAEIPDLAEEGDWISGATEGYSVTMIEFGDFQ